MTSEEWGVVTICGLALAVIISMVSWGLGLKDGMEFKIKESIKSGVAEWAIDKTTGVKSFKYIIQKEK